MDINKKIQLGEFKNVNSVNEDNSIKVDFEYSSKDITEDNVNNILDVTEQFDVERQNVEKYRIHGQLQFLSITNNLIEDYETIQDFFTPPEDPTLSKKNITNEFRFFLLKPVPPSGYTLSDGETISPGYEQLGSTDRYIRKFEVVKDTNDFDFYRAGFSRNIFNEPQYAFNIFGEVDIKDAVDGFGIPVTELFIFAQFNPGINGGGSNESYSIKQFDEFGQNDDFSDPQQGNVLLEKGDIVDGDVVVIDRNNYSQRIFNERIYKAFIPYTNEGIMNTAAFDYNPFIPVRLRYLADDLRRVSQSATDYQRKDDIPSFAFNVGGNNFVWRNILDKGFLDPLTGIGVNYPFINQRHYIFMNEIIAFESDVIVNENLLGDTVFDNNTQIQSNPTSDLNKIGEKC